MMDENTTLGDLLELQLHHVEEEVKNIVDKAVKEMAIEKVLIAPDAQNGTVRLRFTHSKTHCLYLCVGFG